MKVTKLILFTLLINQINGIKIGFLGDTTATSRAANVYDIMVSHGAEVVVQNGDFDYTNNPTTWDNFLQSHWFSRGKQHVLMTSGNHDVRRWGSSSGYKAKLYNRLSPLLQQQCYAASGSLSSQYGELMACKLDNVHIVMAGWNEMNRPSTVTRFIEKEFASTTAKWRVCVWHRPEGSLNPGNRHTGNYGSWAAYEACRKHGALVFSGHSHLYGRTKLLSNFERKTVVGNSQSLVQLSCGNAISVVTGMGGKGPDHLGSYANAAYWDSIYSTRDGGDHGAVVCDFPASGEARCDFLVGTSPGRPHDSWRMTSSCGSSNPSPPTVPRPTLPPMNKPTLPPVSKPTLPPVTNPTLPPTTATPSGQQTITVHITDAHDDVEVSRRHSLYTTSSDLELMYDGHYQQQVGIRWQRVRIPRGAKIVSAKIEFVAKHSSSRGRPVVDIAFDNSGNAQSWGSSHPGSRSLTSSTRWIIDEHWSSRVQYNTPDLATGLQQVVNRNDWDLGNSVAVVMKDGGSDVYSYRRAYSANSHAGPVLHVTFNA